MTAPTLTCRDRAVLAIAAGLCFLLAALLQDGLTVTVTLAYAGSAAWIALGVKWLIKMARESEAA